MFILYIKQAWNLLRQEPLFSTIYIIGTGLSISIVMVLSIVFYIKVANIYPETDRDKLLIINGASVKGANGGMSASSLSYNTFDICFRSLESAEAVTAIYNIYGDEPYVQPEGRNEQWPVEVKYVDDEFWKVFAFNFRDGKPFTREEVESGILTAVISESLAQKLFGTKEVSGKYVSVNFRSYRIAGVVKDVSYLTGHTYAHVWIPYTTVADYKKSWDRSGILGSFAVYVKSPSKKDIKKVRHEIMENMQKYDQNTPDYTISFHDRPDRQWQSNFRIGGNHNPEFNKILLLYGLLFFIFLLVPAVSLSGMIDSRMDRRIAELGVRRAFGAPNGKLMRQVITENFLFTLLGGIVGLIFSYIIILISRDWIFSIGRPFVQVPGEGTEILFTPAMLINFSVFGIALTVCIILNFISACVPAWRASRRDIVYSLNGKQ